MLNWDIDDREVGEEDEEDRGRLGSDLATRRGY